jgi:hypothetical protein
MLAEMADQRADIETLLTIVQRLDAMVDGLLNEVHSLQVRLEHHGHLPFDIFDKIDKTGSLAIKGAGGRPSCRGRLWCSS